MMFSKELIPYKSREYIKNRYFDHVSYNYIIYNVCQKDILSDTAIVFRIQNYKNSKILRIVDVLGDYKKLALVTGQIDIYISTTNENIVLFKGDGDQDRPN